MLCGAPALPRIGLALLAYQAAAGDLRQLRARVTMEPDHTARGSSAVQEAPGAPPEGGASARALPQGWTTMGPELEAHQRQFPHVGAATSFAQQGIISAGDHAKRVPLHHQAGNGNSMFPFILLAGFFVFAVLHSLDNYMRDYMVHEGPPPKPSENRKAEGGKSALWCCVWWRTAPQTVGPPPKPSENRKPEGGELNSTPEILSRLEVGALVLCLVACSVTSVIYTLYNKWLYTKGGFPHPIYLSTFHMAICFAVFWFVRMTLPASVRDSIMPDAEKVVPWKTYVFGFIPISVLYGYGLGMGNLALIYSSVAFLQMVKPILVLFTSLAAFALQLEAATVSHVIIVLIIFGGVSLAATGDVEFNLVGCVLQLTACMSEGLRLALLQKVMTKDARLDPITTLYQFAPVAGLSMCLAACFVETPVDWGRLKSPTHLIMNCIVALVLNILVVTVVKKASAVVFALHGIVKDVVVIAASAAIFHTPIAPLEAMGYGVSACGIAMYVCYKGNVQAFKDAGFIGGFSHVIKTSTKV